MTDFLNLAYAEQCSTAIVTLKNGVLESQGSYQGMYQISDPINGKPSWTLDPFAIWYSLQNAWLIGTLDYIGEDSCDFYTYDDYGGLDDANNQWYYGVGSNWILTGANDVNITCTSNNIFLVECSSKNADYKI